jgi:tRNA-2-methylthio-N6-dimethylallyladenosine synthase
MPGCGISTDIIAGFCGETEEDHQLTLSLMDEVSYNFAYMYAYSERPKTLAERKFKDDVPEAVKKRRLSEIVAIQQKNAAIRTKDNVGKVHRVLIEGNSKKSDQEFSGRNSQNSVVVFPKEGHKPGDYVDVYVHTCTATTLIGKIVKP